MESQGTYTYSATLDAEYLERTKRLCATVEKRFKDEVHGGYYLCASDGESLILRPKETYDGAMPSGNSLMAWNLVRLSQLNGNAMTPKWQRASCLLWPRQRRKTLPVTPCSCWR